MYLTDKYYLTGVMEDIRCIIIEDELRSLNLMKNLAGEIPGLHLQAAFSHPLKALDYLREEGCDLIFIDIRMPGMDGFQFIEKLENEDLLCPFIFVTAYEEYLIEALRKSAVDYLLKPVSLTQLRESVERFRSSLHRQDKQALKKQVHEMNHDFIRFNVKSGFEIIRRKDIIMLEAERNYTRFILQGKQELLVTQNIGNFEFLLETGGFLRIHRSSIINAGYFRKLNRLKKTCTLGENGHEYSAKVSTTGMKALDEYFSGS